MSNNNYDSLKTIIGIVAYIMVPITISGIIHMLGVPPGMFTLPMQTGPSTLGEISTLAWMVFWPIIVGVNIFWAGLTLLFVLFGFPAADLKVAIISCACTMFWIGAAAMLNKLVDTTKLEQAAAERLREEEEQTRLQAERDYLNDQKKHHDTLTNIFQNSIQIFEEMPNVLNEADSVLDRAQKEFSRGAISPFWSCVEHVLSKLGEFNVGPESLKCNIVHYNDISKLYHGNVPLLPINEDSVAAMVSANTLYETLNMIVQQAFLSFPFTQIYEQRRTSQILISGFRNLEGAIHGMGNKITSAIEVLGNEVSVMQASINEKLREANLLLDESKQSVNSMSSLLSSQHLLSMGEMEKLVSRHDRALEMLDNLQRRQKPKVDRFMDGFDKTPYY